MARVPLVQDDAKAALVTGIFDTFRDEGRGPSDIFRALANVPGLMVAHRALPQALRGRESCPPALREIPMATGLLRWSGRAGRRYGCRRRSSSRLRPATRRWLGGCGPPEATPCMSARRPGGAYHTACHIAHHRSAPPPQNPQHESHLYPKLSTIGQISCKDTAKSLFTVPNG
jgi:hypothetical protein